MAYGGEGEGKRWMMGGRGKGWDGEGKMEGKRRGAG